MSLTAEFARNYAHFNNLAIKRKIEIRNLTVNDEQQVYNFLDNHYPNYFRKYGIDDKSSKLFTRTRAKIILKNNQSVGAFETSSNTLIGSVLGFISKTNFAYDLEDYEKEGFTFIPRLETLRRYWASTEQNAFKLLGVDQLMFMGIGVVVEEYRETGIGHAIASKLVENFHHSDCKYLVTLANTDFVIEALKRNGFRFLQSVKDVDYIDQKTNTKPFQNVCGNDEVISFLYKAIPVSYKA